MKVKRKYTEKVHAKRLIKMMEINNPCIHCPAEPRFDSDGILISMWNYGIGADPCKICYKFVDTCGCPCNILGQEEAIKRSWIALEEKGYI